MVWCHLGQDYGEILFRWPNSWFLGCLLDRIDLREAKDGMCKYHYYRLCDWDADFKKRDISWSLVLRPSLWVFIISPGCNGLVFFASSSGVRRGYQDCAFWDATVVLGKV